MKEVNIIKNPESELLKDLHIEMLAKDRRQTMATLEYTFQCKETVTRRIIKVRCENGM